MINNHKSICEELAPEGWWYGGYDGKHYFFVSGNYDKGFKVMNCREEDLTKENLECMAKHNLSRVTS